MVVFPAAVVIVVGMAWMPRGRRVGLAIGAVIGGVALAAAAVVIVLRLSDRASGEWTEFSIGPASGRSSSIQGSALRANGITLRTAIATAYDVPAVRVIGPPWLADTRYSIQAVLGADKSGSFRSLLQQELELRLRLKTHLERHAFEVFILTAGGSPRLERSTSEGPAIWIGDGQARFRGADMQALAGALQSVLGQPVIDETGLRGWYDLEFAWTADRVPSVTGVLHERYGLRLSSGRREMEALVVDYIRRDAALVVLGNIGRMMEAAPPKVREGIADILSIR